MAESKKTTRDKQQSVDIAVIMEKTERMESDIQEIKVDLKSLPEKLDEHYVSKNQFEARFEPVRNIVYGMVGFILLAFLGAMSTLIIR